MESLTLKIKQSSNQVPSSLYQKLNITSTGDKLGMTEDRMRASIDKVRGLVSFFRQYPDLYLDSIKDPNEKFNFFFYQRLFLRAALRHRYMYATFPRALNWRLLIVKSVENLVNCEKPKLLKIIW